MQAGPFTTDFATVLGVAAVTSIASRAAKQPAALGYLAAGLVVGPYVPIPVYADPERVAALAEFGVVLVMLAIGLEFRLSSLTRVLPTSGLVGLLQVLGLGSAGYAFGRAIGFTDTASLFLASSIGIASTMVVSSVYATADVAKDVRAFVFGTLVVQDLLAIVLVAAMTAVAAGQGLDAHALAVVLARLALVLAILLGVGLLVVPRLMRIVEGLGDPGTSAVVVVALAFVVGVLVQNMGYSVALGAFVSGSLVAESGLGERFEHALAPMKEIFAAVFFVAVGMSVDPHLAIDQLGTAISLAGVVAAGQLVITTFAGTLAGNGLRRSLLAGASFGQVGEFGFILAGIGLAAGVVPQRLQTILVTTAVLTSFTTPLVLRVATRAVGRLDRMLPSRLSSTLSVYEAWLERARSPSLDAGERSTVRRLIAACVVDGVVIVAIVLAAGIGRARLTLFASTSLGVRSDIAAIVLAGATALSAAPFVFGLVRLTDALARTLVVGRVTDGARGGAGVALATRAVRAMLLLAVAAPTAVALTPLLGTLAGGALALAALGAASLVYRAAGAVDREVRGGAATVLAFLATGASENVGPADGNSHGGADPAGGRPSLPVATSSVVIAAKDFAVGRSLAKVDLRAETGATVVAVIRADEETAYPPGAWVFEPGDRILLVGTEASREGAITRLRAG